MDVTGVKEDRVLNGSGSFRVMVVSPVVGSSVPAGSSGVEEIVRKSDLQLHWFRYSVEIQEEERETVEMRTSSREPCMKELVVPKDPLAPMKVVPEFVVFVPELLAISAPSENIL